MAIGDLAGAFFADASNQRIDLCLSLTESGLAHLSESRVLRRVDNGDFIQLRGRFLMDESIDTFDPAVEVKVQILLVTIHQYLVPISVLKNQVSLEVRGNGAFVSQFIAPSGRSARCQPKKDNQRDHHLHA